MAERLRVLHVDDDPDIREVTAFSLELDPDLELMSASSGAEALAILQGGFQPDVVLLDVMMPGMDGPQTLARLRDIEGVKDTPVIFMTARGQARERSRYLSLGAQGVILKPFDPVSLASDLRDLLAAGCRG